LPAVWKCAAEPAARHGQKGGGVVMSAVAPEMDVHGMDAQADHLGAAVYRSLNRTLKNRFSVSFLRAMIGGVLTFGILPVFGMPRRFRDYISFERQQLGHLADWMGMIGVSLEADGLRDRARAIRFREGLYAIGALLALVAIVAIFMTTQPFSLRAV